MIRWEIKVLFHRFRAARSAAQNIEPCRDVIESVTATESVQRPIVTLYRHSLVNRSCNCWTTVLRVSRSFVVEVPDEREPLTTRDIV